MTTLGIRVLVLGVLASLCALLAPAATAGTTGTISGTIAVAGPSPSAPFPTQAQIQVQEGGAWRVVENAYTTAFSRSGPYTSEPLVPGTYRVQFTNPDAVTQVSAPVTVSADLDAVVDVTLDPGASITGQLTVPAGGQAVDGFVRAYIRTSSGNWLDVDNSLVEPNGKYFIGGLVGGDYKVGFSDLKNFYAPEFYDNVATLDQAVVLSVPASTSRTGIDVTLSSEPLPVPPPVTTPTPTPTPLPTPVPGAIAVQMKGKVRIVGTVRVGEKVRAKIGTLTPSAAKVRYHWVLDGHSMWKLTGPKLKLTPRMEGRALSVNVAAYSPGLLAYQARTRSKLIRPAR